MGFISLLILFVDVESYKAASVVTCDNSHAGYLVFMLVITLSLELGRKRVLLLYSVGRATLNFATDQKRIDLRLNRAIDGAVSLSQFCHHFFTK